MENKVNDAVFSALTLFDPNAKAENHFHKSGSCAPQGTPTPEIIIAALDAAWELAHESKHYRSLTGDQRLHAVEMFMGARKLVVEEGYGRPLLSALNHYIETGEKKNSQRTFRNLAIVVGVASALVISGICIGNYSI